MPKVNEVLPGVPYNSPVGEWYVRTRALRPELVRAFEQQTRQRERRRAELAGLARTANEQYEKGRGLRRQSLDHYRAAGRALNKANATVPVGKWEAWVAANWEFSASRVRHLRQLADFWAERFPGSIVTIDLILEEREELEDEWRRISGIGPRKGPPKPPKPKDGPADDPPPVEPQPQWVNINLTPDEAVEYDRLAKLAAERLGDDKPTTIILAALRAFVGEAAGG